MVHLESLMSAILAGISAIFFQTFGLYSGATLIAICAAIARLAYSREPATLKTFWKFLGMSLPLTMLMVHIGKQQELDGESVIILSGVIAFMSREVLELIMKSKEPLIKLISARFK